MAKLTLTDITNIGGNPTSAETNINANGALIEAALENTLSRDGTTPNAMGVEIDMNSLRIINLADGINPQDAATVSQITSASLPLQAGNAGFILTTDGSTLSWDDAIRVDTTNNRVSLGGAAIDTSTELVVTSATSDIARFKTSSAIDNPTISLYQGPTNRVVYLEYDDDGDITRLNADGDIRIQPSNGSFSDRIAHFGSSFGYGTTAPSGTVHIFNADAGAVSPSANGQTLVLENNDDCGVSILAPDAYYASVILGSPAGNNAALLQYRKDSNEFSIAANLAGIDVVLYTGAFDEAIRMASGGDVSIGGLTTPQGSLHVYTAASGAQTPHTLADDLIIENNASGGITFKNPATNSGYLMWADSADNQAGSFRFNHSTNRFDFAVGGSTSLQLDGDSIGVNVIPSATADFVQSSTTGIKPVVEMTQADVSEEFMRFIGTAAAATLTQSIVAEADVTTATRAGFVKVYVQDDGNQITDQAYFMPVFTLA